MGGVVSNPEPPAPSARRKSTDEGATTARSQTSHRRHSIGSSARHTSFKAPEGTPESWPEFRDNKPSTAAARRPRVQTPRPATPTVDDEEEEDDPSIDDYRATGSRGASSKPAALHGTGSSRSSTVATSAADKPLAANAAPPAAPVADPACTPTLPQLQPASLSPEPPAAEKKVITVLHFNDAYHIDASPAEPVGGVTRFMTAVRKFSHLNPLFFFGGDIFSPSIVSMVTKGKHMVGVLNTFGVQFSVVGNHDLDFGLDQFCKLAGECTGKWVCSNIWDANGHQLENTVPYCVTENNGVRVGVLGVIEEEWIATLTIPQTSIRYRDFIEVGREMATFLKMQKGCQTVVALTHMRYPNDEKLAAAVPEIDLILGGHDHFYQVEQLSGTQIAKAGDDFHYLIAIQAEVDMSPLTSAANRPLKILSLEQVPITRDLEEDAEMTALVGELNESVERRMSKVIAISEVELDAATAVVRLQESALGNYFADIMRLEHGADIVIFNGGTLRSGEKYGPGKITIKDLLQILPFEDICIVVEATGAQIRATLENGVSQVPKQEGRFPQVSGVKFRYDPSRPPGQRVIDIHVGSLHDGFKPIDENATYKLCCKSYMAEGRDGYDCLKACRKLTDEENAMLLSQMIRQHWLKQKYSNAWLHPDTPRYKKAALKWKQVWKHLKSMRIKVEDLLPRITARVEGRIVETSSDEIARQATALADAQLYAAVQQLQPPEPAESRVTAAAPTAAAESASSPHVSFGDVVSAAAAASRPPSSSAPSAEAAAAIDDDSTEIEAEMRRLHLEKSMSVNTLAAIVEQGHHVAE